LINTLLRRAQFHKHDEARSESMLIIPAIDLKDGKCVRLKQGRMEDDTVFSDDPVATAQHWVNEGARRLHLVDLNGAFAGTPIQIGGGIRSLETIEHYLEAGVTFVIIGTKAVQEPEFVEEACKRFAGHIIVGIDAMNGMVATDGWANVTDVKATDLAKRFADAGVSSIVYTDIARDGMMQGVNVEQTVNLAQYSGLPVIASGGVTNLDDVRNLKGKPGILGAITGRAIYEGTLNLREAQLLLDENRL